MSNRDSNGYELPWILLKEDIPEGQWLDIKEQIRFKIIPNKLWKHKDLNSEAFALMSCFRDAVINLNSKASEAILLHIQDAHKWKE